jgi:hypothetical protein
MVCYYTHLIVLPGVGLPWRICLTLFQALEVYIRLSTRLLCEKMSLRSLMVLSKLLTGIILLFGLLLGTALLIECHNPLWFSFILPLLILISKKRNVCLGIIFPTNGTRYPGYGLHSTAWILDISCLKLVYEFLLLIYYLFCFLGWW